MANKKVSDKDYLFISSMLKARENRMLRRDRLEQMLSSGSFEEAARLLAEIGWPDLSGKGSAAVSEALAKRQAEIYAEITRFVPEKELVGIFRLKYDYHNAKTIVKGEGAGVDAAYLLSDAGQVEPEKLEAAFREDSFQFIPGKLGPAMAEAKGILARTGNPQLADFALDKAYYEDLKALADAVSSPFVKGYVTTLIDSANLRAAVRCVRMGKDAEFLRGALVAGGNVPVQRLVQAVFSGEREKYFSISPASVAEPVISSDVRRRRRIKPESFMMRSNCSVASMNLAAASLSRISLGTICPRQRVLQLLCRRLRSLVVFVRNR